MDGGVAFSFGSRVALNCVGLSMIAGKMAAMLAGMMAAMLALML